MADDGAGPGEHPPVELRGPAVPFEGRQVLMRLQGVVLDAQAGQGLVGHHFPLGQGDDGLKIDVEMPGIEGGEDRGLVRLRRGRGGPRRNGRIGLAATGSGFCDAVGSPASG